jgi:hypothetical protein
MNTAIDVATRPWDDLQPALDLLGRSAVGAAASVEGLGAALAALVIEQVSRLSPGDRAIYDTRLQAGELPLDILESIWSGKHR